MKRREFVSLAGGVALSPLVTGYSDNPSPGAASLVDTPEKRRQYLESLLNEICAIGPRPSGSESYRKGAEIFLREIRRGIPDAMLEPFTFERWVLKRRPELTIGGASLETYPSPGSSGTGPDGIRGHLVKTEGNEKLPFTVVDSLSGKPLAWLSVSPRGDLAVARSWFNYVDEFKCLPIFNIGKKDMALAEDAVQEKLPVFLKDEVDFIPDAGCVNVIGSLPGSTDEEILVLAHLDTVYSSPGANDNTASAIGILILALAFSGAGPLKRRMTFVATSGEEIGMLGATAYAERRKKDGTYGNIKYLINVDSATWGPDMRIATSEDALWEMIREIDARIELSGTPARAGRDGFSLDGKPFRETGARAIYVNSKGYDLDHLWHRPEDTPESVPADCVEIFFRLMQEYLNQVQLL